MIRGGNLKKIIIILFTFISIVSTLTSCFAFQMEDVNIHKLYSCGELMKYKGMLKVADYAVYTKDGIEYPAYCVNAELPGADENGYDVSVSEKLHNNEVWKVIINGYPYRTVEELGALNEKEAYTATRNAIYCVMYGRDENDYSAFDTEEGRRTYKIFREIIENYKKCTLSEPTDVKLEIKQLTSWNMDIGEYSTYVSKEYELESNVEDGEYEIEIQGLVPEGTKILSIDNVEKNKFKLGEKFKIVMPLQKISQSESFTIKTKANIKSYPILYGKSYDVKKQNYAITGMTYEIEETSITEDYMENLTKIKIHKQEYGTKETLKNVEFQLLDEQKNILRNILTTDENGDIILENMLPGKYFLKEIKTLDGYNLYTDYIELNLGLNEEINVVVNNTKKTTKEINKNYENIEIVSNKEETKITEDIKNTQVDKNEEKTEEIINMEVNKKVLPRTGK